MFKIIKLNNKNIIEELALFFHNKWGVPKEAYIDSMNESLNNIVPAWYYILDNNDIIAGAGVIENDFHKRHDLTPNICALYVKEEYRGNGLAKRLLNYISNDLKKNNINNVYLITTHTKFYEHCGFNFLDMIEEDDGNMIRCYHRKL
ncbi:MAG: GNAT family N-acetyltransferase [Acholeplasmatales bacterium]|nr:GNAT family N-acetyltransferase [Acholeplasmatales bacterium]